MKLPAGVFPRMLLGIPRKLLLPMRGLLAVGILVVTRPAVAEVMDKELSRSDVAHALLLSLALAVAAASLHRWLLLPLFIFGPARELGFAGTEWHDPFVGPAISQEEGTAYGLVADGAMTIVVVAHLTLWLLSNRFRHRHRSASRGVVFATALLVAVLFHAWLGFNVSE